MAEITTQVSEGGRAVLGVAKKHYLWMGLVLLAVLVLAIRYRAQITAKLASVLPVWAKQLFAISGLAIGFLLLGTSVAEAACCVAPAVRHFSGSGILSAIAGILASGALLGYTGFKAPDVKEAKLDSGAKQYNFSYTSEPGEHTVDFFLDGTVPVDKKGRPLVALDTVVEVSTTVTNPHDGTHSILDDDLAGIIKTVKINEPRVLGTILDDTVGTGPIVKHVLEFVGHGFNRGADAPVAAIEVPDTGTELFECTRYWSIPHAMRCLDDPMISALWMGIMHKASVTIRLAAANYLDGVSTGALLAGPTSVRVTNPVVPYNRWHWPLLASAVLEQPTAGTETDTLRKFGQKNAEGTLPVDWLFLVSRLSNKVGLPGNCALDNITEIDCEVLEIARLQNVPAFLKARLEAQVYGRSSANFNDNGNYIAGAVPSGMNLGDVKLLNLLQPGLDMPVPNMRPVGKGFEMPISYKYTTQPTDPSAYVLMSMRYLSQQCGPTLAKLSTNKLSSSNPKQVAPA